MDNKSEIKNGEIIPNITYFTYLGLCRFSDIYRINPIYKPINLNEIEKKDSNYIYRNKYNKVIHEFNCYLQLYSGIISKSFIFPYPYNFTILKKLYFHNYVKEHNQSLYSIYKLNIPISSGSKIYHDKHKTKNV